MSEKIYRIEADYINGMIIKLNYHFYLEDGDLLYFKNDILEKVKHRENKIGEYYWLNFPKLGKFKTTDLIIRKSKSHVANNQNGSYTTLDNGISLGMITEVTKSLKREEILNKILD